MRGFIIRMGLIGILMALLAASVGAQDSKWENISASLLDGLEGYSDDIPGARRFGAVMVDRHTGDVLAGLHGKPFGVYRSQDAGKTWSRFDDGIIDGGWQRSFCMRQDLDKPGRMAFFTTSPPAKENKPTSAMTLDGGKSWIQFADPFAFQGQGGWRHGMVDWSQDPVHIIAQNRIRPKLQISVDNGKEFKPAPGKIAGVMDPNFNLTYIRAKEPANYERYLKGQVEGYGLYQGNIIFGEHDGIEVSIGEDGEMQKVADFIVTAYTPVLFDGKLYWGSEKGVIMSDDAGKTWSLMGSELPMVRKGPYIGADANNMVVVAESGVFHTSDGGKNWKKLTDLFKVPDAWRADEGPVWLRTNYAWDHTRNILYVTGLAGSLYKMEVK